MLPDAVTRDLGVWRDPAVVFTAGPGRHRHSFWLDAGPHAVDGWSWLGSGAPAAAAPRDVRADLAPRPGLDGPFRGGWVGWLGYDDAAAAAGAPASPDPLTPPHCWLRVDEFVAFDHTRRRMLAVAPAARIDAFAAEVLAWTGPAATPPAAPRATVTARHTPDRYAALVERCRDAIRAGDAYQLCLTTRFETTASLAPDPVATYLRLRTATPAHHGGIIVSGAHALLSASPERFLQLADGIVRTRPIKGTRPRGGDLAEDTRLLEALRNSPKERAENVMIVDLMRNDLQQVCRPGTVAVEGLLEVESYAAVHQLVSTVAGRLLPGTTLGEILAASFPAGSMTGAPKLSAMTILHRLEERPRGAFAGCFGWVGDDGAADLAMVIRSIVIHPDGAYVGAGGGITWGSIAAAEVAEVGVKARGPLAALGGELPPGW